MSEDVAERRYLEKRGFDDAPPVPSPPPPPPLLDAAPHGAGSLVPGLWNQLPKEEGPGKSYRVSPTTLMEHRENVNSRYLANSNNSENRISKGLDQRPKY